MPEMNGVDDNRQAAGRFDALCLLCDRELEVDAAATMPVGTP